MGCTAEYKRPGHSYDRSIEKLKRKEATAIQVIKFDDAYSTYKAVVEQAFRLNRIDAETRLKLLSEAYDEEDHLYDLYEDIRDMSCDTEVFVNAAMNHDVIEKGLLCYKELQAEFGKETADLIAGVTDYRYADRRGCFLREWIPGRGLRELSWRERKEASLERLKKSSLNVLLLKLVDADNELAEIEMDGYAENGYPYGFDKSMPDRESMKWYYGELLKLFRKTQELRPYALTKYFGYKYHNLFLVCKT